MSDQWGATTARGGSIGTGGDGSAELARAEALIEYGRASEAVRLLGDLLARLPSDARVWQTMARAQQHAGAPGEALAAAQRAIALDPLMLAPYLTAGELLARSGRVADGARMTREAIRLAPDAWRAHSMQALILAGCLSKETKPPNVAQAREAMACATTGVHLAPMEANAHYARGAVASQIGSRHEAEASYRRALALDPQHHGAHNDLARLRLQAGSWTPNSLADAATGFSRAVVVKPTSDVSRDNLELVLVTALARTTYLILLAAVSGRLLIDNDALLARLVPVLALAIPSFFAVRYWRGLTPQLRTRTAFLVTRSGLRVGCGLIAAGVLCMLGAAIAPHGARQAFAGLAALLALLGRLLIWQHQKNRGAPARSAPWALAFLAVLTGLVAVMMLAAVPAGGGVVALGMAAGSSYLTFLLLRTLWWRRS